MTDPVYEKLIPALNSRGMVLPSVKCDEFFALVEFLFTPEEAEIFYAMPHGFASAEVIANNMDNCNVQMLSTKLESMCDKGLIQSKEEGGKKLYEAMPFLPGIMELQFLKGMGGECHRKVVQLYNSYKDALRNLKKSGAPTKVEMPAAGTRLAVDKDVYSTGAIIPYKEMKELIMDTEYIAFGICHCRNEGVLNGTSCNKPLDNCMIFGTSAKFTIERGFTKRLTKEEAIAKLDAAEEAGLIHNYSNTPDHFANFLCNCCMCHCILTKGLPKLPAPSAAVNARYLIHINDLDCIGCEACIDRCPVNALKMVDGKLTREEKRCIGCGLCMYVCPTDALVLGLREAGKVPLKKC